MLDFFALSVTSGLIDALLLNDQDWAYGACQATRGSERRVVAVLLRDTLHNKLIIVIALHIIAFAT